MDRRARNQCLPKRLYYLCTPYIQIGGFIFLCGMNWQKVAAYEDRLVKLEIFQNITTPKIDRIDQKLDDLLAFWNVPHRE